MSKAKFNAGDRVRIVRSGMVIVADTTIIHCEHVIDGAMDVPYEGWIYQVPESPANGWALEHFVQRIPDTKEDEAAWQRFKDKLHLDLVEIKQPEEVT